MTKNSDNEKPELQWVEDLIDKWVIIAGEVVVGIALAVGAFGRWLASLLHNEPPRPPSPE